MSAFSEQLEDLLERHRWTQKELARLCGTEAGTVSRWCGNNAHPDRETLGRVIAVLEENDAVKLLKAWVEDSLPPGARDLIRIEPRNVPTKTAEETPEDWPPGLGDRSRRKFSEFAKLAMANPDVMKIVDVLYTAVMRAKAGRS